MKFQNAALAQWLMAACLLLVVPNLLFWILTPELYLIRGVFVMEYFLLACLYPFIPRKLFVVLWIVFTMYDALSASTSLFFMDVFEIAHALTAIPKVSMGNILLWTVLALAMIAIAWLAAKALIWYNKKVPFLRPVFVLPVLALCFLVDYFIGTKRNNIVSVPSLSLVNSVRAGLDRGAVEKNANNYLGSVAQRVFGKDSLPETKQMLILVESWGLLQNRALHQDVLQPLYELSRQYTLEEGTNRYQYLTQAGELREITGYVVHYYQADNDFNKQHSLFFKKQQQGYRVVGVHGYSYRFYNRQRVWPSLGVQEMYFEDKLKALSLPMCGNQYFMGICDSAIGNWAFDYMKKQPGRKEFLYWLTLNTHLPIEVKDDEGFRLFARKWEGVSHEVLQLAYQHKLFFAALANKLRDPLSPKVHVLLVGDHAPPFVDPQQRKMYDEHVVPYINIVPNK